MQPADTGTKPGASRAAGTILVAEDNAINGLLMQTLLEEAGYVCDVVSSGAKALMAVRARRYDLVLMDIQLPDMDGFAVSSRIRAMGEAFAGLPIVAVTGHALAGEQERFNIAGITGYVGKPLDIERFLSTVRHWVTHGVVQSLPHPSRADTVCSTPLLDVALLDDLRTTMPPTRFQDLILAYVEGDARRLATIHSLLAHADLEGIRREAHDLKGTSGNFGARRLQMLAARLEADCKRRDKAAVSQVIAEIDTAAPLTWVALRGPDTLASVP